MHAIIRTVMLIQKLRNKIRIVSNGLVAILIGSILSLSLFLVPNADADRFEEQISELREQNSSAQVQVNALELQANSLEEAIRQMQAQIDALQAQIAANQAKSNDLQQKIKEAEEELARQKELLGQNIRAMYLEGEISTIEMLATSKDLSHFVDKQQYREIISAKIKAQVDKITALRLELKAQREEVERLIIEDTNLRGQVAANKAEQDRLLALNQTERANFNNQIKENNKKITDLRREQALENIRLFGGGGGVLGGGGYPWGDARCLATGQVDGWCGTFEWGYNGSYHNWATGGYAFRNCTDWVAWRVKIDKGFAPAGLGNAKTWDDRAPSYGYGVGSTPRQGAAAVSNSGYYGHVMYVEAVNGDGTITVSDYNRAGTGKYDINNISPNGLTFVYF
jgi:peptidoglycan hydrolase CwlO-like protein